MDRWEYKVVRLRGAEEAIERLPKLDAALGEIQVQMNALGSDGWELILAGPYQAIRVEGIVAVLRRRLAM